MRVDELIKELKKLPEDAIVYHLWDGELRTEINVVYLSNSGKAVTADNEEVCYSTESRPTDAPTAEEQKYWHTK